MQKMFVFDINQCVACHACAVACSIENATELPLLWRQVSSSNPFHHPELPLFSLSMACNHCEDAPCMSNCPADAYSRDLLTGAVLHHEDKCIGCKYCTWACPYDAPKFNPSQGIVEKCTFCNHRLTKGLDPACVNLCPTGALQMHEKTETDRAYAAIEGFAEPAVRPSIQFIPLKKEREKPKISYTSGKPILPPELPPAESKITFRKEAPLAVFTLLVPLLTGALTARFLNTNHAIVPWLFVATAFLGLLLSAMHLGRKKRAYRAIIHWQTSWLSREILFYGLFVALSVLYLYFMPYSIVGKLAAIAGFMTLFSIDKVYQLAKQATPFDLHSAHALLNGLFFTALFAENNLVILIMVGIKTALYVYRKIHLYQQKKPYRLFISGLRLDFLISFPVFFWWLDLPNLYYFLFASFVLGEAIDRAEFYEELSTKGLGASL